MSTGQSIIFCTNGCGMPVARRGMCVECAQERRAAQVAVRQTVAAIRVECKVELPQHIEPLTPLPMVAVVAPQRPQEAPKAVQAAPALPVLPPRPLVAEERFRLATVAAPPKGGGSQPQRRPPLEVDPHAPLWRCRFRGCEREREWRGACGRCGRLALHRGQADLLLPPRQRRYPPGERARLAAAIVGYMREHGPGGRASDIGKALGIPSLLFWSVMRMLRLSKRVVRDHRGAYRLPDAPPRLPVTIRGRFELLLRRGPLTTEAAVEAIPAAPQQVARLTDRLQRRGVVRKVGLGGAWMLAG